MTREIFMIVTFVVAWLLGTMLENRFGYGQAYANQSITTERADVRPCSGKGRWFPASESSLHSEVKEFLDEAGKVEIPGRIYALVAPHAGYLYSGAVAAQAYKQVVGLDYDVVVIIGVSHGYPLKKASVHPTDFYETPLGRVAVDKHTAMALLEFSNEFEFVPAAHRTEHSVENQIPFLQETLPNVKIVPILVNNDSLQFTERVAKDLAIVLQGSNVLFVASTDMTHYPSYENATRIDRAALEVVKTFDFALMDRRIAELEKEPVADLHCVFCGKGALYSALGAAKRLGATTIKELAYRNSGDVTGSKDQVVGYCALAAVGPGEQGKSIQEQTESSESAEQTKAKAEPEEAGTASEGDDVKRTTEVETESIGLWGDEAILTNKDKALLLDIAKKTVVAVVQKQPVPEFSVSSPELERPRGAFVTLKRNGRLRGCIGRFQPAEPLHVVVKEMAVSAASQDFRFRPVSSEELPELTVEISALTPMRQIDSIEEIKVGRDGLYLEKGARRGVLLPQVPIEQGWDLQEFLEGTCRKAGLPPDAYKNGAKLFTFSAEVFHEKQ